MLIPSSSPQTCSLTVGSLLLLDTFDGMTDPAPVFADGLAAAAVLSIMNYLLLGWGFEVDGFYEKSFEIWLACVVVFPGAGNIGFTLLEYRLGHKNLLDSLVENLSWIPFLCVIRS